MISNRFSILAGFLLLPPAVLFAAPVGFLDVSEQGVLPSDGVEDAARLLELLREHRSLYFPPGDYRLDQAVYAPSGSQFRGAGSGETRFVLGTDTVAFRVEGVAGVCFRDFTIERPFDNSREEMIFVYSGASNVRLQGLRSVNNRSRAPSFHFNTVSGCSVVDCHTINDQRRIFEDGRDQVYGSGITFNSSENIVISHCSVVETRDLTMPDNPYVPYYQAGAIQTSSCRNVRILHNRVLRSGNGIDAGGTDDCLIEGNVLEELHQAGIKLVNGSKNQIIRANHVTRAGITAIWLSPGNTDLPVTDNLVEENIVVATGQGIAEGRWEGWFTNTVPSGIHVDEASSLEGRSHDNLIRNNTFYENEQMLFGAIVRPSTFQAYDITLENNVLSNEPAPPPPSSPPVDVGFCVPSEESWRTY